MIQKEIVDLIEQYDTIIIHHHIQPDPDCIGSALGLKYILQASYPEKRVYAVGKHNEKTRFLGELDEVHDDVYNDALGIIVDVGDKHRVEDQRVFHAKQLIKIDHHPMTQPIADLEWVNTSFAAVTEMIIDLVVHNQDRLMLTTEAARVLYAGLLTDSGRFYYENVSERTLHHGALVYAFPFDKQELYKHIYYKSIEELKFTGFVQTHFTLTEHGVGYMKVNQEILNRFNLHPDDAADMVNILSNIKEVYLWIFFVEYDGFIRVEFRSRGPVVNTLAKKFNGGGHRFASGAIIQSWDEVEAIIDVANQACIAYFEELGE
ncbi:MAG TPA: bifunctional oligoribonuclease/PAP phosphatase NrnA [Haloplasmataceae bacterium]